MNVDFPLLSNFPLCRLHYIPLSQSYQELYNIYAFFSGATPSMLEAANVTNAEPSKSVDGEQRLRRIARAGKQWKQTIGRQVDMEGKMRSYIALG